MASTHRLDFEEFNLDVTVSNDGEVFISFISPGGLSQIDMAWDELREAVYFVGKHGLNIDNPWFGHYDDTVEGAEDEQKTPDEQETPHPRWIITAYDYAGRPKERRLASDA
jgi:hypothetical protein